MADPGFQKKKGGGGALIGNCQNNVFWAKFYIFKKRVKFEPKIEGRAGVPAPLNPLLACGTRTQVDLYRHTVYRLLADHRSIGAWVVVGGGGGEFV